MNQRQFTVALKAAGIETGTVLDGTIDYDCTCENCQWCRAAYALHEYCFKSRFVASLDVHLQRVVEQWERTPEAIKSAIFALMKMS